MATRETDVTILEPVTAWHPMLVAVLEELLPAGWRLVPEMLLHRLPQRVDIVIVRQDGTIAGTPRKLHSIFDFLRPHTLIEHKGPTDDLAANDALVLLGYAAQYMVVAGVNAPDEMALMVVADSIPKAFARRVRQLGGRFVRRRGGLWRGHIAGMALHGVATGEAFRSALSERLLFAFSRAYLAAPGTLLPSLDSEEERVYLSLYEAVEQFRKKRGSMALKDEKQVREAHDQFIAQMLARLPLEQRLAGLAPEQRLAGLAPEQRLAGLAPEQRLAGLAPEQWLSGLPPEQRLLALTDEELAAFPDGYLRSLSPDIQSAIRRRIGRP